MTAAAPFSLRRARPWLGTLVDISLKGDDEALLATTMEACFAAIARVHALMSFHEADSDVSRLNREAALHPAAVAHELIEVLSMAQQVSTQSDGLFDVTVANRLVARGHLPKPMMNTPTDETARWEDIVLLSDGRVQFRRPLLIDLGGIAKGYAVDRALAICRQAAPSLRAALINAGGDLARFGHSDALIRVRHPADASRLLNIDCGDYPSVATSAYDYDNPVHMAPSKMHRAECFASATVLASSCTIADALTKVVLLDGDGQLAQQCLRHFDAEAIVINPGGQAFRSAAHTKASTAIQHG